MGIKMNYGYENDMINAMMNGDLGEMKNAPEGGSVWDGIDFAAINRENYTETERGAKREKGGENTLGRESQNAAEGNNSFEGSNTAEGNNAAEGNNTAEGREAPEGQYFDDDVSVRRTPEYWGRRPLDKDGYGSVVVNAACGWCIDVPRAGEKIQPPDNEYERSRAGIRNWKRDTSFFTPRLRNSTFDRDDGWDAQSMRAARLYTANFPYFLSEGKGLYLYGAPGNGKTFAAACIANALIMAEYNVRMTNMTRLAAEVDMKSDNRSVMLDRLCEHDLLIIDDFGTERKTDFVFELIYNVIDARYTAGKPVIFTSNLEPSALKDMKSTHIQRIFSRMFSMCMPLRFTALDHRMSSRAGEMAEMKRILGLGQ